VCRWWLEKQLTQTPLSATSGSRTVRIFQGLAVTILNAMVGGSRLVEGRTQKQVEKAAFGRTVFFSCATRELLDGATQERADVRSLAAFPSDWGRIAGQRP